LVRQSVTKLREATRDLCAGRRFSVILLVFPVIGGAEKWASMMLDLP
jgi:hypothetical protein